MSISVPKLPAALVAVLGFVATVLTAAAPSLSSPWREIAVAVLAVLAVLGVGVTHAAVRAAVKAAHAAGRASR